MITRDNKYSLSGTAQNARQRFGEVLKHYRLERDLTHREVARRCKVAIGLVEKWESGEQLPNVDEWKALCRGIARQLNGFNELYQRARKEMDDEARERAERSAKEKEQKQMRPDTKINTALGDKLASVVADPQQPPQLAVVPSPEPAADETKPNRRTSAYKPPGSYTEEAKDRRKAFVRELIKQRPKIRTSGNDSVLEAVRKAFGIGISPVFVEEIREELKKEQLKAEILRDMPPPVPPTLPAMAAQLVEHVTQSGPTMPPAPVQTHEPDENDISTAVQLILEALPGLHTFTITVDENGEAAVDYQIRKVKVEMSGGSIKVKR